MKTYFFLLQLLFCVSNFASGQEARPEFLYGGQLRIILPGIEPYVELPVAGNLVVRLEADLGLGYARTTLGRTESGFGLILAGTVSPRWYYNYTKRVDREKSVYRNSANFFSLRSTLQPGLVVAKTSEMLVPITGFTVIPSWGLRRPLGKFIVEASAGVGFRRTAPKDEKKTSGGALDIRVGIGF